MKSFAVLEKIENTEFLTEEQRMQFTFHLQHSLLLALKEQGCMNEMQYRYAAESLQSQCRTWIAANIRKDKAQ